VHRRARTRAELDKVLSAIVRSRVITLAHGDAYEAQSTRCSPGRPIRIKRRGVTVDTMIANVRGLRPRILVHIIAAVSTLIVLIVMRWSAQLVVRGADSATQIARFRSGATGRRASCTCW